MNTAATRRQITARHSDVGKGKPRWTPPDHASPRTNRTLWARPGDNEVAYVIAAQKQHAVHRDNHLPVCEPVMHGHGSLHRHRKPGTETSSVETNERQIPLSETDTNQRRASHHPVTTTPGQGCYTILNRIIFFHAGLKLPQKSVFAVTKITAVYFSPMNFTGEDHIKQWHKQEELI